MKNEALNYENIMRYNFIVVKDKERTDIDNI